MSERIIASNTKQITQLTRGITLCEAHAQVPYLPKEQKDYLIGASAYFASVITSLQESNARLAAQTTTVTTQA